ncbi:hypothetical protein D3C71_2115870 [compost metagenome]
MTMTNPSGFRERMIEAIRIPRIVPMERWIARWNVEIIVEPDMTDAQDKVIQYDRLKSNE